VRNEDADLATQLAALAPDALAELQRVLEGSVRLRWDMVLLGKMARPVHADLATMIAEAETNDVVALALLQTIHDLRPLSPRSRGPGFVSGGE
jgi:hypothetical protein